MGPAPSLATYEAQAASVYEPQKEAEQKTLTAEHQASLNTLNTEKQGVGTQYDFQEEQLKSSLEQEAGKISQMYTTHLLGNFSGLQGNDMGGMFARGNTIQNNIEQQRTNAINSINTSIANENLKYDANMSALPSKYQSLEADAAQKGYADAVKTQREQFNADRTYNLGVARLNATTANNAAKGYKVSGKLSPGGQVDANGNIVKGSKDNTNGYSFTGPNDQPISMAEYVAGKNGGQVNVNDVLDLLQNGSSYDRQIYRQVQASGYTDPTKILDLIAQEDSKNYYGFRG